MSDALPSESCTWAQISSVVVQARPKDPTWAHHHLIESWLPNSHSWTVIRIFFCSICFFFFFFYQLMGLQTKLQEGDSRESQWDKQTRLNPNLQFYGEQEWSRWIDAAFICHWSGRDLFVPDWPRLVRQITDGSGSNLQPLKGGGRSRRVSGGSAGCRRGQTEHLTVRKQQQRRRCFEPTHNKAGKSPIKRYISL